MVTKVWTLEHMVATVLGMICGNMLKIIRVHPANLG